MKEMSYQLVAIYDRQGNRWEEQNPEQTAFCNNLVGCIARNMRQTVDAYWGFCWGYSLRFWQKRSGVSRRRT